MEDLEARLSKIEYLLTMTAEKVNNLSSLNITDFASALKKALDESEKNKKMTFVVFAVFLIAILQLFNLLALFAFAE